jgi:phage terminase large subunit
MTEITLPANGWKPRHYQAGFWEYMQRTPWGARAVLCHHRRAGKDHTAINWAAVASQKRVGLYIHVFPYANQGRRVIWNGIDRNGVKFLDAFPEELVESRSDLEMRLKLKNGSIYQVLGADDPDKLVGINCVGAIFSEYALMNPVAFDLVRPILNENGGWAIFPSTPRGRNHFHDMIFGKDGTVGAKDNPKWYVSIETIKTTGAVNEAVVDEDRQSGVEEAMIQQEYYCSFDAALAGAYYEKQMSMLVDSGRIGDVPHDPALEVHTAWDLGINDSTTIWIFQMQQGQPQMFDYIEASNQPLTWYLAELRKRGDKDSWMFGTHYGPHDIASRDFTTGKTRLQTARELGFNFTVVPKHELNDGIDTTRALLPKCRFDAKKCRHGVEALKSYRKEWDERLRVYRDKPRHDWASHPADAFRYLAQGIAARDPSRVKPKAKDLQADNNYDPFA